MHDFWARLTTLVPSLWEVAAVAGRLLLAATLGGIVGWEREKHKKPAGLRTHMLVAIGAALFILPLDQPTTEAVSHIVQGIVTGIGFIGAGCILKLPEAERVRGLTTAGSIWITAALGVGAAFGRPWVVMLAALITWLILGRLEGLEKRIEHD